MDDPKHTEEFYRERRIGRVCLYIELVYVLILTIALVFRFDVFAHLIVGQFILISLYLIVGWLYSAYLRITGKQKLVKKNHYSIADWFAQKFPRPFNEKTMYRVTNIVMEIVSLALAVRFMYPLYGYMFENTDGGEQASISFMFFGLMLLAACGISIGLLMSYRHLVRNCSVILMVFPLFLLVLESQEWALCIFTIVIGAINFWLYYRNEIV